MDEKPVEVEEQILLLCKSGAELPPEVCVLYNISKKESKKRLIWALILILAFFIGAFFLIWFSLSRWWRLFSFFLLWGSAFVGLQAITRTEVHLALQSKLNYGFGDVVFLNIDSQKIIKRRAFNIVIGSIVFGVIGTCAILSVPVWHINY